MRSITTGTPFTNMDKLLSQHGNVIILAVKCEMKLVVHKQVLMVHPKYFWSCDYFFTLGLNFMRISVKSPEGWTYYTVYVILVKGFVWNVLQLRYHSLTVGSVNEHDPVSHKIHETEYSYPHPFKPILYSFQVQSISHAISINIYICGWRLHMVGISPVFFFS